LIRRIMRDQKERGSPIEKTIKMWRDSVIHAHHKYVEPTKYLADISIPFNRQKQKSIDGLINIVNIMIQDTKTKKRTKSGKNSK
jgi:uridine kinase